MLKIQVRDIIAIVILIGCFILIGLGKNHFVQTVLAAIVGYYFGRRERVNEIVKEKLQKQGQ